jgi:hypothetical protein
LAERGRPSPPFLDNRGEEAAADFFTDTVDFNAF